MARKAMVADGELVERLSATFREVGYEGASLSLLSEATGLKRASLYHRFPGGKEQMGLEVLRDAGAWLGENVLTPLAGPGTPRERVAAMVASLDAFYASGRKACLLNLLSSPIGSDGPFSQPIRALLTAYADALARLAEEAGQPPIEARRRALRTIALIQGSLVLARGLGDPQPFRQTLDALPDELLGSTD